MPLLLPPLQNQLIALFRKGSILTVDAAHQMAAAYSSYCQSALFGASRPVFTGAELAALQATLLAAMEPKTGSPAKLAAAWQKGVLGFWMGPPIPVLGAQNGVVTAVPGALSLTGSLTALFSNGRNRAETCGMQLATLLDAATRTAVAVVAPPPSTIVPIV